MDRQVSKHRPKLSRYIAIAPIWLCLAMTDIGLRLFPAHYRKHFIQNPAGGDIEASPAAIPVQIERIMADVRRAASHPLWFNMSCLRRSLVLQKLLGKRGIHASITFGVKREQTVNISIPRPFTAHAWLTIVSPMQYAGLQLDPASVNETFSRLERDG